MKLKRLLAVVLVGTMAASMASGAAVSAEEKQKLVIWSWGADEEKKAREDAVAIFQENHPEIEVEHSVIPSRRPSMGSESSSSSGSRHRPGRYADVPGLLRTVFRLL